jgi:hypothetical protein
VFIADYFYEDPVYERLWREHWVAPIGTVAEYRAAAAAAGFATVADEDVSVQTALFWKVSAALIALDGRRLPEESAQRHKQQASLRAHTMVREGLMSGGLRYVLMSFARPDGHVRPARDTIIEAHWVTSGPQC